jgi:hypothetical protein
MRWRRVIADLRRVFSRPDVILPGARVLGAATPWSLGAILERAVSTEEDAVDLELESPWEILTRRWRCETLLDFEWHSLGPFSWSAQLGRLDVGEDVAFIWLFREIWVEADEESTRIIAAVAPAAAPAAHGALFENLLHENGARYGMEDLFGSLPTITTNHRPDLVPAAAVQRAYWDWMNWASRAGRASWITLRDEVLRRAIDPVSPPRLDTLIRQARRQAAAGNSELEGLSADDRRRIFENYLSSSYREEPPSPPSGRP